MTKKNPFCISFGKQPFEYIDRTVDRQLVIDTFDLGNQAGILGHSMTEMKA